MRHTPSLWNVAWSPLLFWDGRAASLEEQVRFPVEHPDEMGDTLDNAVDRFCAPRQLRARLRRRPSRTTRRSRPRNIAKALAAYERTLVSPPTRFDQWVAGDADALSPSEVNGLQDLRRQGPLHQLPHRLRLHRPQLLRHRPARARTRAAARRSTCAAADYAFKTPTLRELAWTAPYMHDGSLGTLDDVVRIYEMGGVERPTRSQGPAAQPQADGRRSAPT